MLEIKPTICGFAVVLNGFPLKTLPTLAAAEAYVEALKQNA